MTDFKARLLGKLVVLTKEHNFDLMHEIFAEFLNTPEDVLQDAISHFIMTMGVRIKMEDIVAEMGENVS